MADLLRAIISNNIVGAILGNLALTQQDLAAGRPVEESLQQIQRAALRARELVQRIQTFSRADAPSLGRQSMRRIVEEVLPLVQVTMPAGATLRSELQSGECPVWADATQMHQVLLNLCTNAWQALQGQAGLVTVSLDSLAADAPDRPSDVPHLPAGPLVRLGVSDTGSGIRTEHRERIFEPYFITKGGSGGTGLGLSVVHGIVQAHRGAIRVDSRPGAGLSFWPNPGEKELAKSYTNYVSIQQSLVRTGLIEMEIDTSLHEDRVSRTLGGPRDIVRATHTTTEITFRLTRVADEIAGYIKSFNIEGK